MKPISDTGSDRKYYSDNVKFPRITKCTESHFLENSLGLKTFDKLNVHKPVMSDFDFLLKPLTKIIFCDKRVGLQGSVLKGYHRHSFSPSLLIL